MTTSPAGGSILVVGPEHAMAAVRSCFRSERVVARVEDTFGALERLVETPPGAVVVWMASLPSRADGALAALRQAAPADARLILVARPDEEPQARGLLDAGADDYLIWPLQSREVACALAGASAPATGPGTPEAEAPAIEPIAELAEAFALAETNLSSGLDRLTALVARRLNARGCTIELLDVLSVCGEAIGEPVLTADLDLGGQRRGKLSAGARRSGAYTAADAALLAAYAKAAGVICRLAGSAHHWQHEALTDELTDLPNRRGLMRRLPEILETSRRQRTTVTLLLFDIDNFKHYNDAYSHNAGDEILRETGQLFSRHTRQHDVVARYGGDEFVVVFWEADYEPRKVGSKPPRDVVAVLNRFRRSLERHEFQSLGPEAQGVLTISGGLVTFPWDGMTPEELIRQADEALLLAKRQGKNRIWLVGQGPQ